MRNKEVADTPEERVRQQLIAWLTGPRGVPLRSLSVETSLAPFSPGGTGRADLLILLPGSMDRPPAVWLLAECKAPGKLVSEGAFAQAGRYLRSLSPDWVVLTDGLRMELWKKEGETYLPKKNLPHWSEIVEK